VKSEFPWRTGSAKKKKLDDDEISWMTKEFAGNGCRGWKMAEGVVSVVTRGDSD
jgi:hypothetical protein